MEDCDEEKALRIGEIAEADNAIGGATRSINAC